MLYPTSKEAVTNVRKPCYLPCHYCYPNRCHCDAIAAEMTCLASTLRQTNYIARMRQPSRAQLRVGNSTAAAVTATAATITAAKSS